MYVHGMRDLFRYKGCVVEKISIEPEVVHVKLRPDQRCKPRCSKCGAVMSTNRVETRTATDMGLVTRTLTVIEYPAIQGRCRPCQRYETITPPEIDSRRQVTFRFMRYASRLCQFMPVTRVADLIAVSDSVVRRWDQRILELDLPEPCLDNLAVLLVDEKSIGKRHQYVTLVMNGVTGELLHMAEGKKKESFESFFEQLTDSQKASIEAVGMDRSGSYYEVVREHLPKADIVFDRFHLMQNYNDVIDDVRREAWREADEEHKSIIKGQRYILFKNPENRTDEDNQKLQEVLEINSDLCTLEILKTDLRRLWCFQYRAWAERWLTRWVDWAVESQIPPLQRFARGLLKAKDEVLNYCKHRITSGRLEGFNNLVSRIIHRGCGIKNTDYLYAKLRQESLRCAA